MQKTQSKETQHHHANGTLYVHSELLGMETGTKMKAEHKIWSTPLPLPCTPPTPKRSLPSADKQALEARLDFPSTFLPDCGLGGEGERGVEELVPKG